MNCTECTITIKTSDEKFSKKFLVYGVVFVDLQSEQVKSMVNECMEQYKIKSTEESPAIVFKTKTIIQG